MDSPLLKLLERSVSRINAVLGKNNAFYRVPLRKNVKHMLRARSNAIREILRVLPHVVAATKAKNCLESADETRAFLGKVMKNSPLDTAEHYMRSIDEIEAAESLFLAKVPGSCERFLAIARKLLLSPPAQVIGDRWVVERVLDQSAPVLKVVDAFTGSIAAAKIMRNATQEIAMTRYAQRLCPDTCVRVLSVEPVAGEKQGTADLAMIMEFCTTSLFDIRTNMRKKYKIGPEVFATVFQPIGEALVRLHAVGFIHGDIKPDNIMFRSGNSILIDFGLSVFAGNVIERRSLYTVGFVPPEFIYASRKSTTIVADTAMDIFALGVTMLLFLKPEYLEFFSKISRADYMDGVRLMKAALDEEEDADMASLLREMVQTNPAMRPTAQAVLDALLKISRRFTIEVTPEHVHCSNCFEIACSVFLPLPSVRERISYIRRIDPVGVDLTQCLSDEFRWHGFQNQYSVLLENSVVDAECLRDSFGPIRPVIPDLLDEGVDGDDED